MSKALDRLKTGTVETKLRALERLEQLGPRSAPAVPMLISMLRDAAPGIRAQAALALGRIGPEAKAAIPDLVPLLNDPDHAVRAAAAGTLGHIGPQAEAAIPALVRYIRANRDEPRYAPVYSLPGIDAAAVPALLDLFQHDGELRGAAGGALGSMGPSAKDAVPVLIEGLRSPDRETRATIVWPLSGKAHSRSSCSRVPCATKTREFGVELRGRWRG